MARVDVKVVLLGQQSVGKSCLVSRFITGTYDSTPRNTIGAAFAAKKVKVASGRSVSLGVWDTAGAERFEALSRLYYHGSRAAVVCCDATSAHSFAKLRFWVEELREQQPGCRIYIALTKADLLPDLAPAANGARGAGADTANDAAPEALSRSDSATSISSTASAHHLRREVSEAELQAFAQSVHARVFVTSAKTGLGVDALFQTIAEDMAASVAVAQHQAAAGRPHDHSPPSLRLPSRQASMRSPARGALSARSAASAGTRGGPAQGGSSCC